jgi:hypothetical protein
MVSSSIAAVQGGHLTVTAKSTANQEFLFRAPAIPFSCFFLLMNTSSSIDDYADDVRMRDMIVTVMIPHLSYNGAGKIVSKKHYTLSVEDLKKKLCSEDLPVTHKHLKKTSAVGVSSLSFFGLSII